jgi:hypothetical protein
MIQALLRKKLDPLAPEPERREDCVTSTVFGTLAMVQRWALMAEWLGAADSPHSKPATGEIWFWPSLATRSRTTIPDVCVRIGKTLFVIEAKVGSGLSRPHWRVEPGSETARAPDRLGWNPDLARAVDTCRVQQVFLVDARTIARNQKEMEDSRRDAPQMTIGLATWQDLDRRLRRADGRELWRVTLRDFLEYAHLSAFDGFRNVPHPRGSLLHWGRRRKAGPYGMRRAVAPLDNASIRGLMRWCPGLRAARNNRWSSIDQRLAESAVAITRWRSNQ